MRKWTLEDIIYEDEQVIVCRKHAGMAVQSARTSQMDMESALRNYRRGGFIGIVQRLDQPVEGLLVFGKSSKATAVLNAQQQNGKMKKQYLAVFVGTPAESEGTLEDFLLKDGRTNTSKVVVPGTAGAKRAELSYRIWKKEILESPEPEEKLSVGLAEVTLNTGRHHQIRVQMAAHGMPLWADGKYNSRQSILEKNQQIGLCAYHLEFEHPKTGKRMVFEAEPEGEIFKKLNSLQFLSDGVTNIANI